MRLKYCLLFGGFTPAQQVAPMVVVRPLGSRRIGVWGKSVQGGGYWFSYVGAALYLQCASWRRPWGIGLAREETPSGTSLAPERQGSVSREVLHRRRGTVEAGLWFSRFCSRYFQSFISAQWNWRWIFCGLPARFCVFSLSIGHVWLNTFLVAFIFLGRLQLTLPDSICDVRSYDTFGQFYFGWPAHFEV